MKNQGRLLWNIDLSGCRFSFSIDSCSYNVILFDASGFGSNGDEVGDGLGNLEHLVDYLTLVKRRAASWCNALSNHFEGKSIAILLVFSKTVLAKNDVGDELTVDLQEVRGLSQPFLVPLPTLFLSQQKLRQELAGKILPKGLVAS